MRNEDMLRSERCQHITATWRGLSHSQTLARPKRDNATSVGIWWRTRALLRPEETGNCAKSTTVIRGLVYRLSFAASPSYQSSSSKIRTCLFRHSRCRRRSKWLRTIKTGPWFANCFCHGMWKPQSSAANAPRPATPFEPSQHANYASLRTRFNPNLVGFGIADPPMQALNMKERDDRASKMLSRRKLEVGSENL